MNPRKGRIKRRRVGGGRSATRKGSNFSSDYLKEATRYSRYRAACGTGNRRSDIEPRFAGTRAKKKSEEGKAAEHRRWIRRDTLVGGTVTEGTKEGAEEDEEEETAGSRRKLKNPS